MLFFFSSRRRQTSCALVTGVQTCALPIWFDYATMPLAKERADMKLAIEAIRQATGQRPLGWYTGRFSENTLKLVAEDGGFVYSSDTYDDDLPYWTTAWVRKPQLILPYTFDNNDMKFGQQIGRAHV